MKEEQPKQLSKKERDNLAICAHTGDVLAAQELENLGLTDIEIETTAIHALIQRYKRRFGEEPPKEALYV